MFVNRNRNKSGTVSVRVLQKRGRNNVLIKSFGSSKDEKEVERMVAQAKEFIQRQNGTYYHLFNQPAEQGIDDFVGSRCRSTGRRLYSEGCSTMWGMERLEACSARLS